MNEKKTSQSIAYPGGGATNAPVIIDGAQGEGGGQMLRTALVMSVVTGRPFTMVNVRAKRHQPGLRRQHLTCLKAVAEICGAEVEGLAVGACRVDFRPGAPRAGHYRFEVGTAGSVTLLAQTVLPVLLCAEGPSEVTLTGGTHVPMAPTWEFFEQTYLPQLRKMGVEAEARLVRHGFYPAGGGEVRLSIRPWRRATPLSLCERGPEGAGHVEVLIAHLAADIAETEASRVCLGLPTLALSARVGAPASLGPGNACLLRLPFEHVTQVFSAIGTCGKSRNAVANTVIHQTKAYLKARSAADVCLSDQLLLPLVMAAERLPAGAPVWGTFTMPRRHSAHFDTNWAVLRGFREDCDMKETAALGSEHAVTITIGTRGLL